MKSLRNGPRNKSQGIYRIASRPRLLTLLGATATSIAIPTIASAHITPKPSKVKVGSTATIAFTIGHGCAGSPTTMVSVKMPPGVAKVVPEALSGWKSATNDGVVTYTATKPLPDKTKATISITMTMPAKAGSLLFPMVQTCEVGKLSWTSTKAGADHPAPKLTVLA